MADSANDTTRPFRYTAAVAKVRGTYPYISDIVDDVPVVSKMDYWDRRDYATPYHPAVGYLFSARPRSAPSHLKSGHSVDSQYHESCQPKKPAYLSSTTKQPPLTDAQLMKADMVTNDRIWKQSVGKEQKGLQKWDATWSYLTDYDAKGNKIEKQPLPDSFQQYQTGPVPVTNSRQYGARLDTQPANTMMSLEQQLSKANKRRKLDSEMICY